MSDTPRRRNVRVLQEQSHRAAASKAAAAPIGSAAQQQNPTPPEHGSPAQRTFASLGRESGQTALNSSEGKRPLGMTGSVLPELSEAEVQERKWWKHPAFIVSIILTFLALAAVAAWLIVTALTDNSVTVSGLDIEVDAGNAHLTWSGPDAAYSLYAVHGDGETVDLTQRVRGTAAWVPAAAKLYESDTCFVVRPTQVDGEVSLDASTLNGQRAQSVCVADMLP